MINKLGQKAVTLLQKLFGTGVFEVDQGRVQTLKDVGISLERQNEKLLQLPKTFLRVGILDLLRQTVEGPLHRGGREVDASRVGVGVLHIETVGARADGAFVDNVGVEVEIVGVGVGAVEIESLHLFADGNFLSVEGAPGAVGKLHDVSVGAVGRALDDLAHRAFASETFALVVALLDEGHHLCADGKDEMGVGGGGQCGLINAVLENVPMTYSIRNTWMFQPGWNSNLFFQVRPLVL